MIGLAMPETCKAKYVWTCEHLTTAMRHHHGIKIRPGLVLLVKTLAALFLVAIGVVFVDWFRSSSTSGAPWPLLITVLVLLYVLVFERINSWLWSRGFDKRPDANTEVEWEISSDGIHAQSALGTSTLHWTAFVKVVEASDGFLFYPLKNFFHWMPFSAFESPECIEAVRTFVTQNKVPLIQSRSRKSHN